MSKFDDGIFTQYMLNYRFLRPTDETHSGWGGTILLHTSMLDALEKFMRRPLNRDTDTIVYHYNWLWQWVGPFMGEPLAEIVVICRKYMPNPDQAAIGIIPPFPEPEPDRGPEFKKLPPIKFT